MIRINLLTVDRARAQKKKKVAFQAGQKLVVGCSLILILAALFIGWRYWTLNRESAELDAQISAAQQETTRLRSIIEQVQRFEQQRAQLQQRVALIEQLRRDQTGPVRMLDQISRSLPAMLWLTELKETGDDIVIDGQAMTVTALTDFVSNLQATGYFERSIEIVSSTAQPMPQKMPGDLVKFEIKAKFAPPTPAPQGS